MDLKNIQDCFQRRGNARLLLLRRTHAALRSSDIRWIDISETNQVLAYVRPRKQIDDNVMVLLNYGAEPVGMMLPPDEFKSRTGILIDLLHGGDVVIGGAGSPTSLSLAAHGVRILKAQSRRMRYETNE